MQLSKNFWLYEFTASEIAERHGIDNVPEPNHIEAMKELAIVVLERARESVKMPVIISSGFRSARLNLAIGGSPQSQHMKGEAADLTCRDNKQLFFAILNNVNFDQLIWEHGDDYAPSWVHVSYKKGKCRHQVLRAVRDENGQTRYEPFFDDGVVYDPEESEIINV